ncbi:hypothetical protein BX661DRAFT_179333 [Kickxella alabastrina]|uniref:uncharacterized protein n=1 Tax=Kickxella alabastrina TaxID=61397 RepID=UPI00221F9BDF|nr:uncharacterized protein BX661DRAFT_179333 [Kickxella alabastrina]KAI7833194.1 hypothetical protein BX661DRAFT_179333 [Kickxella alabastrina]
MFIAWFTFFTCLSVFFVSQIKNLDFLTRNNMEKKLCHYFLFVLRLSILTNSRGGMQIIFNVIPYLEFFLKKYHPPTSPPMFVPHSEYKKKQEETSTRTKKKIHSIFDVAQIKKA